MTIPQSLIEATRKRELIPFVGAGLSVSVGRGIFPDWATLVGQLIDRLEQETSDTALIAQLRAEKDLPAAAERTLQRLHPDHFVEIMRAGFLKERPPGADLSAVEALWRLRPRVILTTNYEDVLIWPFERSLTWPYPPPSDEPPLQVHNDDAPLINEIHSGVLTGGTRIWHLHGSIRRPGTLILTTGQYRKLYARKHSRYRYALDTLRSLIATRPLLFVGFSLTDPFVRKQYRDILELTSGFRAPGYILIRKGELDADVLRDEDRIEPLEFEDFGAPMVAKLHAIGMAAHGDDAEFIGLPPLPAERRTLVGDLLARLAPLVLPADVIGGLYNACRPAAWPPFPRSGDGVRLLAQAVARLGVATHPAYGTDHPLLAFLAALAEQAPAVDRPIVEACLERAGEQLLEPGERAATLARLRAYAATPDAGAGRGDYVLVRLLESDATPAEWSVQAWLFGAGVPEKLFVEERRYAAADSATLVYDLLDQLEARRIEPEDIALAFMLPRRLLLEAVDGWRPSVEITPEPPIGASHVVTVRPFERIVHRRLLRRARQTWESVRTRVDRPITLVTLADPEPAGDGASERALWIRAGDFARAGFATELATCIGQGIPCVIVAGAHATSGDAPQGDLVAHLLQLAVPIVVWIREPLGADVDAARTRVDSLLRDRRLDELPHVIHEQRVAAMTDADAAHAGRCVALMWDNMDYLPPDHDPEHRGQVLRA